jgi:hypothetical protein
MGGRLLARERTSLGLSQRRGCPDSHKSGELCQGQDEMHLGASLPLNEEMPAASSDYGPMPLDVIERGSLPTGSFYGRALSVER